MFEGANPLVLTICSGKGGIGKSFLSANLAYAFSIEKYSTLIWDADIYFPNQHLLFGVEPAFGLNDVYSNKITIEKAEFPINEHLYLLADAPASGKFKKFKPSTLYDVYMQIENSKKYDIVIIDTPSAGINEVIQCCSIADMICVVIDDQPTSILDAYGLLKILLQYFEPKKIKLLVNNVIDSEDADEFTKKLNLATENFLNMQFEKVGFIPYDRDVRKSIINQNLFLISNSGTELSKSIRIMANVLRSQLLNLKNNYKSDKLN